jgi:hypothetical protein
VNVVRIGPSRETGDDVQFPEESSDHEVGVVFGGQIVELSENANESGFDVADGLGREELSLPLKTAMVLDELFPVELDSRRRSR